MLAPIVPISHLWFVAISKFHRNYVKNRRGMCTVLAKWLCGHLPHKYCTSELIALSILGWGLHSCGVWKWQVIIVSHPFSVPSFLSPLPSLPLFPQLIKYPVDVCSNYTSCDTCLMSGDPICGWCTLRRRSVKLLKVCKNICTSQSWLEWSPVNPHRLWIIDFFVCIIITTMSSAPDNHLISLVN